MPRSLILLFILFILMACGNSLVFSEYQSTDNGTWSREDAKEFSFSEPDTISPYNLFIHIRNDNSYAFSNLFLIADLTFPDGKIIRDTLEYEMANPDGTWLGKGYGSIKENKLWYKENIVFPVTGVYTLRLSHAMRENGSVEGVTMLEGITDVGFEIQGKNQE